MGNNDESDLTLKDFEQKVRQRIEQEVRRDFEETNTRAQGTPWKPTAFIRPKAFPAKGSTFAFKVRAHGPKVDDAHIIMGRLTSSAGDVVWADGPAQYAGHDDTTGSDYFFPFSKMDRDTTYNSFDAVTMPISGRTLSALASRGVRSGPGVDPSVLTSPQSGTNYSPYGQCAYFVSEIRMTYISTGETHTTVPDNSGFPTWDGIFNGTLKSGAWQLRVTDNHNNVTTDNVTLS